MHISSSPWDIFKFSVAQNGVETSYLTADVNFNVETLVEIYEINFMRYILTEYRLSFTETVYIYYFLKITEPPPARGGHVGACPKHSSKNPRPAAGAVFLFFKAFSYCKRE